MADFCWDCAVEVWGCKNEENDLKDHENCTVGHMFFTICEGCGEGWFDRDGKRLDIEGNEITHPRAIQHPLHPLYEGKE